MITNLEDFLGYFGTGFSLPIKDGNTVPELPGWATARFESKATMKRGITMRKAVAVLVLVALTVVLFAVSALAGVATPKKIPMAYYGKVVYSKIEMPHYELVNPKTGSIYVLLGSFDFKAYEGKLVWVEGYEISGPNIYQRGRILKVTAIRPDSNSAPAPDPKPTPVTISVPELVDPIFKALDLSATYNNDGTIVITNLANGKMVTLDLGFCRKL